MPAQLEAPSPSPSPVLKIRGLASVLVCLSHPHFSSPPPVLFVSLTLWVGIAATCWLSDSWADCPLTVLSPEQKSRRGRPSVCPYLLLPCLWKALALLKTPVASSGEARAEAVSRTALPLSRQQKGSGAPCWQRRALACCCHLLSCLWG